MKFSQIKHTTVSALQGIIDAVELPVAVGKISDDDYAVLSRGYGVLNWDVAITSLSSYESCIDIVFKLLPAQHMVDAAVLGVYSADDETIELHYIESFVRRVNEHPLRKRVMLLTIIFSYLLLMALDGKKVALIDPFNETIQYYELFGFEIVEDARGLRMEATAERLTMLLDEMLIKLT